MKEWYLLNAETRPNITGGYENDTFHDYKDDAFLKHFKPILPPQFNYIIMTGLNQLKSGV